MLAPIQKLIDHSWNERSESDAAYFTALMYTGEAVMKLAIAGLVAAVQDDRDAHRYRLESRLVRANGLGEWDAVLDDVLTGRSAQFLDRGAQPTAQALTERMRPDSWQAVALGSLASSIHQVGLNGSTNSDGRIQARAWFKEFVRLRNGTRGHGAPSASTLGLACPALQEAIEALISGLPLFERPWAYLHRNLSGKYRVTVWNTTSECLENLKRESLQNYQNGVYVELETLKHVAMVDSNAEGSDYWFANGAFGNNHYEMLSYLTNNRLEKPSETYRRPAEQLPPSETEGLGSLETKSSVFTNAPDPISRYVKRHSLESELEEQLIDFERHPIVTLTGRGGIGKTSVALQVIDELVKSEQCPYEVIVWFSARDVDLLHTGPKNVRPQGLSVDDFAEEYVRLLAPHGNSEKNFSAKEYLAKELRGESIGPTLFVFDNFETTNSPIEVFRWLDTYIRCPNKILITSRGRGFTGDFEVQVHGMSDTEAGELIDQAASAAHVKHLITDEYRDELIAESNGHPYVIKLLIGELSRGGGLKKPERILASQGEVLTALFERSYNRLSPGAKRVFLTLCRWRSSVPALAVEAVLLRPQNEHIDVAGAIEELARSFFIEEYWDGNTHEIEVNVPLSARIFGTQKLEVSAWQASIEADLPILLLLGANAGASAPKIGSRIETLFRNVAEAIASGKQDLSEIHPVLEFITNRYSYGSVLMARLVSEIGGDEKAEELHLSKYVQGNEDPTYPTWQAWKRIAEIRKRKGDRDGVLHACSQICRHPNVPVSELSNAANEINNVLSTMTRRVSREEKEFLLAHVIGTLERSIANLNATDLSRLAWLYMHLNENDSALKAVQRGLQIEEGNHHCQSLLRRLSD